jgi:hypothetical protein
MTGKYFGLIFAIGWVLGLPAPAAYANSDFIAGNFQEYDPAGTSYRDLGTCRFFTGPRGTLGASRFMLMIGDHNSSSYDELQITGDYAQVPSVLREYALFPDDVSAINFFQSILRRQQADPSVTLTPYGFTVRVTEVRPTQFTDGFNCTVGLTGRLNSTSFADVPVSISFGGRGQFFPGISTQPTAATSAAVSARPQDVDPCPITMLAPAGLAPLPGQCGTADCLLTWKGYQWWTSYDYFGPPFPQASYFWNANNQWSPKNAFVDSEGLHLTVADRDVGGGLKPSAAEVVAMFTSSGAEANLGYGNYLVTAKVKTAASWAELDPKLAFGVFPYERWGTGAGRGPVANPNREIDLAEISRWGYPGTPPSPPAQCKTPLGNPLIDPRLCTGNSQFTLQIWDAATPNLHRYTIPTLDKEGFKVNTVTLVMTWPGPNQPVTFKQYNGSYTLATLKTLNPAPANQWTTSAADNPYIPAAACGRFHLNFWMGDYPDAVNGFNPPPKTLPQEVVVTNFEFGK